MNNIIPISKLINSRNTLSDFANKVIELLDGNSIKSRREEIQKNLPVGTKMIDPEIKVQFLEIALEVIKHFLNDNDLTGDEMASIRYMKVVLNIQEGDFLKYSQIKSKMESLIAKQISVMYQDHTVDKDESLHKVDLQESFDLGYDDFLKIVNKIDFEHIKGGADPMRLDTFIKRRILDKLR